MTPLILTVVAAVGAACDGISPTSPNATPTAETTTALVDAKAVDHGAGCRDIDQVQMRLMRSVTDVMVRAVFLKDGLPANCAVSPVWSSNPRGRLVRTRDAFLVKVTRTRPPSSVMVTARAPNGVQGGIRVPEE
jgi:hypothetical protein